MTKTIDEITISKFSDYITITNNKNNACVDLHIMNNTIRYHDAFDNYIFSHSCTLQINLDVYQLTELGQTINRNNGSVIAYLPTSDVKELAEKTFYEDDQTRVFDFINFRFNIEL